MPLFSIGKFFKRKNTDAENERLVKKPKIKMTRPRSGKTEYKVPKESKLIEEKEGGNEYGKFKVRTYKK